MSKLEVDAIEPQSGTTITIGASGDTVNLVGTLKSNGSPLPGDISEVVAGTGLSGGGTTGAVTLNVEAAQSGITSLGTLTGLTVTGTGVVTNLKSTNNNTVLRLRGSNATNGGALGSSSSGDLTFLQNLAEGMRLTSTGLGIGITSLANGEKLKVQGKVYINAPESNTVFTTGAALIFPGTYNNIRQSTNHDLHFDAYNGGSVVTPLTIKQDGKIGIGTSSPASTLEISKSDRDNGCTLSITNSHIGTDWSSGDVIGTVNFRVDDTSTSQPIRGQIVSFDDGSGAGSAAPNDSAMKFSTASSNTLSERMRITSAGRVGIGTAAPAATLEVMGTTGANFKYDSSSTYLSILPENAGGDVALRFRANAGDAPDLLFKNDGGSEIVRIGNTGNVGIGTSNTTTAKVFVNHAGAVDDNGLYVYSNLGQTVPLVKVIQDGAGSSAPAVYIRNDDADGIALHLERGDSSVTPLAFANQLFIEDNANSGMTIGSPTSGVGTIAFADSGNAQIGKFQYRHDQNSMLFTVNAAERMRIDSSGNLGLGTSNPSSKFESVLATAGGNYSAFLKHTASSGVTRILRGQMTGHAPNNTDSVFITMGDNTATRFNVFANGDVTNSNNSYTGISDVKLKEQIIDASSQWNDIKNISIKKFKFKTDVATGDSDKLWRLGVIAQEVEKISPSLVSETTDLDDDHNKLDTVTKSVKYSILYMKSVKALQEAMERIESLEARITTLENA